VTRRRSKYENERTGRSSASTLFQFRGEPEQEDQGFWNVGDAKKFGKPGSLDSTLKKG